MKDDTSDFPFIPERGSGLNESQSPSDKEIPSSQEATRTSRIPSSFPERIGDYKILRMIGEGGMGTVFEAEQQHPKRPVALKVIRGGRFIDEHTLRMFQREAQTLARLKHPSIAAIYESGRTDDGQHYFAMELVRGVTLTEWLQNRTIKGGMDIHELKLRLSLFRKICEAVAYAHQRGVIHRDLKPSNILIVREGMIPSGSDTSSVPEIKILDFGLARMTDTDLAVTTVVTEVGKVQGTLPYMSPEQLRGNPDEIDLRTDIYSLGVILYEMLTGKLPYEMGQAMIHEMVRVICEEPPRPLSRIWTAAKKLDTDVETIVLKALEKEHHRRYQSVVALAEDIERYLIGQPILARAPSALYSFRKMAGRHKMVFSFVAIVLFLLVGFGIVMTIQVNRIARERDRARAEAQRVRLEAEAWRAASSIDNEKAIGLFRQALAMHREVLGVDNPELALHIYNFIDRLDWFEGGLFKAPSAEVDAEIEQLYREALDIRRRTMPESHPDVLTSIELLAEKLEDNKKYEEAEALYREALSLREKYWPEEDSLLRDEFIKLVWILRQRGTIALDSGHPSKAEPFFRESFQLLVDIKPEESWKIPEAELYLGKCFLAQKRYREAEPLLVRAYSGLKETSFMKDAQRASLTLLVDLYSAQGEADKASEYRALLNALK